MMVDPQILAHQAEFTAFLGKHVSDRKKDIIEDLLDKRTRYLTVVLEDIHKSHNASAVMRTCECFGLQDIHIIEVEHKYEVHPHIASGSARWTDSHHYNDPARNNTVDCIVKLKADGYKVLVTSLNPTSVAFDSLAIDSKTAVVFGTEYYGVSKDALSLADEIIHIPMMGFTDSLNISVSSGIILQEYRKQIDILGDIWKLTDAEKATIRLQWYMSSVRQVERHVRGFLDSINVG